MKVGHLHCHLMSWHLVSHWLAARGTAGGGRHGTAERGARGITAATPCRDESETGCGRGYREPPVAATAPLQGIENVHLHRSTSVGVDYLIG
ncbi:MAG: hypothetical protein ACRDRS_06790 [Pseudonocardiaceae bacterium]